MAMQGPNGAARTLRAGAFSRFPDIGQPQPEVPRFKRKKVTGYQPPSQQTAPEERHVYEGRATGPIQFLRGLKDLWALQDGDLCLLLGLDHSDNQYLRGLLSARVTVRGRDINDRISSLIQIRRGLSAGLRSLDAERAWLRSPKQMLDNRSPLQFMLEGPMENLLAIRRLVELIAG